MQDGFKIYVDNLRDGHEEQIDEKFPPDFLGVEEEELVFKEPVRVAGQTYATDDSVILHVEVSTVAVMPCAVCNEPVRVPLKVKEFYHAELFKEIKGAVFDFAGLLRDVILLEVPYFAECGQGKCPRRAEIAPYVKQQDGYHPFQGLENPDTKS